jgi:hypothetical protein
MSKVAFFFFYAAEKEKGPTSCVTISCSIVLKRVQSEKPRISECSSASFQGRDVVRDGDEMQEGNEGGHLPTREGASGGLENILNLGPQ